jgi:predicted ATP-grasp superfamily ATP-dependent carboligase
VLVTDGGERAALAAVRGLATAGYRVTAAAYARPSASHWSRACSEPIIVCDPRHDAGQFVSDLQAYLKPRPGVAILPATDFALQAVSQARSQFAGLAQLPLPPPIAVQNSLDREALARAAELAGFAPVPTELAHDIGGARAAAARLGPRPIVKSVTTTMQRGRRVTAGMPTRRLARSEVLDQIPAADFPLLVQRAEPGRMISLGGVVGSGQLLAAAASAYIRTWPPEAGNAAYSITITPPLGLAAGAERLLSELGWEGLFELELIEREDGRLCVVDLNPRPYGSMALAIAAGANLPAVWCDWIRGRDRGFVEARPGVRYRWSEGDIRHLVWLASQARWIDGVRLLRPRRHVVHPHLRAGDPLPALARPASLARTRFRSW